MIVMEPPMAPACLRPCACLKCISGLRTFLRCLHVSDMVIYYCSDIIEGNWPQLFFHIFVSMCKIASVIGMSFFHRCFRLKFFRIAVSRERVQMESKTDSATTGFVWSFLLVYASFRRLHICMDWNLHELIKCFSFLTTSIFLEVSFRGIMVCSLNMLVRFCHRIL